MSTPSADAPPHALAPGEVLARLHVARERGLAPDEVLERRARVGRNRLRQTRPRGAWAILAAQFRSLLVALLALAAAGSWWFGQPVEALTIAAVLVLNAAIGFQTELRGVRSMEALRALGRVAARVRRAGAPRTVDAEELVPGDVVVVEAGDVVSADVRLLDASRLQVDESLLTGESTPVPKDVPAVRAEAPAAERSDMLFSGTAVTAGSGEGVVVATGMDTELGRISHLVATAAPETTPLERRLDRLGRQLAWATLGVAALVALGALHGGRDRWLVLQTAIALAVATVPEGLPILATVALGRGMLRMARRNALVKRLSAVETLGATGVVLVDKTGTLTCNRLEVAEVALASGAVPSDAFERTSPLLARALATGVLCNNAGLEHAGEPVGDPLELALLRAGAAVGLRRSDLVRETPEVREVAFDPARRMMATVHRGPDGARVAVKGAPEAVLAAATREARDGGDLALSATARAEWSERAARMAARGLRVLALADRTGDPAVDVYRELTLLGLAGLADPPRPDVRDTIAACRRAGMRVVMVTGDHPATARAIARAVGIDERHDAPVVTGEELERGATPPPDAAIFARITPEQKLALVARFQARGEVVAMTGDGVNDAPALEQADIGVAMGMRGTEVARQAADIVLRDDAFATIVAAVQEGRILFGNIRAFVAYLLSCNLSEVLIVAVPVLAGAPLPLLPLQLLYLNLVTDVFPALALGLGSGPRDVLLHPPRDPREGILERRHWRAIVSWAVALAVAVLAALAAASALLGARAAVTVAFLTLALAQLWHVVPVGAALAHGTARGVARDRRVSAATATCLVLVVVSVEVPALRAVLDTTPLGPAGWALAVAASALPLATNFAVARRLRTAPAEDAPRAE